MDNFNRYGKNEWKRKVLNILVVIVLIAIIGGCGFYAYKLLSPSDDNSTTASSESEKTFSESTIVGNDDTQNDDTQEENQSNGMITKKDINVSDSTEDSNSDSSETTTEAATEAAAETATEDSEENSEFPSNVTYNEKTGHHYAVYSYSEEGLLKKYTAWEKFCEEQGGHLAVINDAAENKFLYNYLDENDLTLAFFGYSDHDKEGTWKWVNGEKSTYTNWASGQPNNGANRSDNARENYAQFYKETADGTWNDAKIGDQSHMFLCEWDY